MTRYIRFQKFISQPQRGSNGQTVEEYFTEVMQYLLTLSQKPILTPMEESFVQSQQTKVANKMISLKKVCPMVDGNKWDLIYRSTAEISRHKISRLK